MTLKKFKCISQPLCLLVGMVTFISTKGQTQNVFNTLEPLFTEPKGYKALYTSIAPKIDGGIQDAVWQQAPWTDDFVDIEGDKKQRPVYATRVKMLWNDSFLFVAAHLIEPHLWATLKQRDAIIYHDNDFEIFIDTDNDTHQYFEIEVNAYNTILDLFMTKPYRNGAAAMLAYDMTGFTSAVKMQGTLNNPSDTDSSWTLEMAIPFRSLFLGNRWKAPKEGDTWRVNFSRVQWDTEITNGVYRVKTTEKGTRMPEHNWVWSPQGVINMHYPERWGYLLFTYKSTNEPYTLTYEERRRQYLWMVYYRQKEYSSKHGKYASLLQQLGITTADVIVDGRVNKLELEATRRQFAVTISDGHKVWILNHDGQVLPVLPKP